MLATVFQLLTPTLAYAGTKEDIHDMNYKFYAARFIRDCLFQLDARFKNSIPQNGINSGAWLTSNHVVNIGRYFEPNDGQAGCGDAELVKTAMTSLVGDNWGDLLIKIGYTKQGDNYIRPASGDTMNTTIVDKTIQLPYAKYAALKYIFDNDTSDRGKCELVEPPTGKSPAQVTYKKVVLNDKGKYVVEDVKGEFATEYAANNRKVNYDYKAGQTNSASCRELLAEMDGLINDVAEYNNGHKNDPITDGLLGGDQAECNKDSPTWDAETKSCGEDAPTCTDQVKGIGWLICPTMEFLANVLDYSYGFLAGNFLQVDTSLVKGAEAPWARFKDIANIAFVIALLFVIYSQVTSVGISNYGIKKMLPKIIVAALLVNLSYIICQVAVDLSNILGYGISRFFTGLDIGGSATNTSAGKALESAGLALNATAAIGLILVAGVGLAMAISFPVILATLLAVAMIALILIARKALIVLLIVVAPLAFVAYLLPNTEQWFKKWAKMFSTLLLLFPLIGVVFGASALAAKIVASAAKDDPLIQLTAIAIAGLPFFVVPGMLKGALSAAGALGTKLSGLADRAGKGVGSSVKNRSQLGQTYQAAMKYREQKHLAGLAKRRGTGLNSVIGRVAGGKDYNAKARLRASDLEASEFEEDVKSATNSFKPEDHDDVISMAQYGKKLDGTRVSEAEQVAAIRYAGKSGSSGDVAKINSIGQSGRVRSAHIDAVKDKKLNNVVGNKVLTEIAKGGTDGDRFNNLVVEAANNGTIAAATIAQSDSTPKFIADAIKTNAKSTDQNAVKLTSQGHQNLQKATDQAYNTPATRAAMTGQMGADLRSININTP